MNSQFLATLLSDEPTIELRYLKNANAGDARTLEDAGFLKCIDVLTYWFYERDQLRKLLDNPILPWKVCDLTEGFEERVEIKNEAETHLETVLKLPISEENEADHERTKSFEQDFLKADIEELAKELMGSLQFPSALNVYTFWNYETERATELFNQVNHQKLFAYFKKVKTENKNLAWKHLDALLRKRTTFLSHVLLQ